MPYAAGRFRGCRAQVRARRRRHASAAHAGQPRARMVPETWEQILVWYVPCLRLGCMRF